MMINQFNFIKISNKKVVVNKLGSQDDFEIASPNRQRLTPVL